MQTHTSTKTVYHGTDVKGINAIRRDGVLRGDWPLFGPGICLTLSRARGFICIKAGVRARRVGRVLELIIDPSLLANASPEPTGECLTLTDGAEYRPLRELRLDDPRVHSWRVLTVTEQERIILAERTADSHAGADTDSERNRNESS